jgi:pimeloyl-ACP methyl ester carboxylesterase/DNA-binding CsgD family transcriptional regulator
MTQSNESDLIDSIYAVAMEPERFRELVNSWNATRANSEDIRGPENGTGHESLERHIRRAEIISSLITANEDLLPQPLQEKLDCEPQSVLALSAQGTIEALNPAAKAQFAVSEGCEISDLPIADNAKTTIIQEVKRFAHQDIEEAQTMPKLFTLTKDEGGVPVFAALSPWTTLGGRRFILLKTTEFVWPEPLTPLIKEAFNLTQAESGIVKLIVGGNSVEDIARIRNTSIKTVRSQIRSIYEKTSTKNQSEFIRLAIGLTTLRLLDKGGLNGDYRRPIESKNTAACPLPEHRHLLSLPDGRILDYAVFGSEDGMPCVFFHNEYFGDVWPHQVVQHALDNNLKIIAPARPYYGRSSPYPEGIISHEQFSEDLNFLLEKLRIPRAVHIAQTFGSMFSLAYSSKYAQEVVALVAIAPVLPLGAPEDEENMPSFARFVTNIVIRHPQILKFILKSGAIYRNRIGAMRFLEAMILNTNTDVEILKDPKNLGAIMQGFQYSERYGYLGHYHDFRKLIEGPWQKILNLKCPIYAIIGTQEKNTRAKRADRLIAAGANINKIMAQGGGEMLFFSHPELIVDTLVKAWEND